MSKDAFVLRIAPGGVDRMPEALATNEIIVGWAEATGMLDPALSWEAFRDRIHHHYHAGEPTLRKAGAGAGHLWRFVRDMKPGDLVVVPYGPHFYVAEVAGPARYDAARVHDDAAYRRPVRWMNAARPIPRAIARSALISRMKTQGTCAYATDLVPDIEECLAASAHGEVPTFHDDLQSRLVRETLAEMRAGRMDSFGFERLIQATLLTLGAIETRIVPRSEDKGPMSLRRFWSRARFARPSLCRQNIGNRILPLVLTWSNNLYAASRRSPRHSGW